MKTTPSFAIAGEEENGGTKTTTTEEPGKKTTTTEEPGKKTTVEEPAKK